MSDKRIDAVIPFPKRLGVEPPRTQLRALAKTSSRELLAAIVTKYPGLTFTADEIRAAHGQSVRVRAIGANEWEIVPQSDDSGIGDTGA